MYNNTQVEWTCFNWYLLGLGLEDKKLTDYKQLPVLLLAFYNLPTFPQLLKVRPWTQGSWSIHYWGLPHQSTDEIIINSIIKCTALVSINSIKYIIKYIISTWMKQ